LDNDRAMSSGRDPNAAFEMPLHDEEPFIADLDEEQAFAAKFQTVDATLLAKLLDKVNRELRTARGHPASQSVTTRDCWQKYWTKLIVS